MVIYMASVRTGLPEVFLLLKPAAPDTGFLSSSHLPLKSMRCCIAHSPRLSKFDEPAITPGRRNTRSTASCAYLTTTTSRNWSLRAHGNLSPLGSFAPTRCVSLLLGSRHCYHYPRSDCRCLAHV